MDVLKNGNSAGSGNSSNSSTDVVAVVVVKDKVNKNKNGDDKDKDRDKDEAAQINELLKHETVNDNEKNTKLESLNNDKSNSDNKNKNNDIDNDSDNNKENKQTKKKKKNKSNDNEQEVKVAEKEEEENNIAEIDKNKNTVQNNNNTNNNNKNGNTNSKQDVRLKNNIMTNTHLNTTNTNTKSKAAIDNKNAIEEEKQRISPLHNNSGNRKGVRKTRENNISVSNNEENNDSSSHNNKHFNANILNNTIEDSAVADNVVKQVDDAEIGEEEKEKEKQKDEEEKKNINYWALKDSCCNKLNVFEPPTSSSLSLSLSLTLSTACNKQCVDSSIGQKQKPKLDYLTQSINNNAIGFELVVVQGEGERDGELVKEKDVELENGALLQKLSINNPFYRFCKHCTSMQELPTYYKANIMKHKPILRKIQSECQNLDARRHCNGHLQTATATEIISDNNKSADENVIITNPFSIFHDNEAELEALTDTEALSLKRRWVRRPLQSNSNSNAKNNTGMNRFQRQDFKNGRLSATTPTHKRAGMLLKKLTLRKNNNKSTLSESNNNEVCKTQLRKLKINYPNSTHNWHEKNNIIKSSYLDRLQAKTRQGIQKMREKCRNWRQATNNTTHATTSSMMGIGESDKASSFRYISDRTHISSYEAHCSMTRKQSQLYKSYKSEFELSKNLHYLDAYLQEHFEQNLNNLPAGVSSAGKSHSVGRISTQQRAKIRQHMLDNCIPATTPFPIVNDYATCNDNSETSDSLSSSEYASVFSGLHNKAYNIMKVSSSSPPPPAPAAHAHTSLGHHHAAEFQLNESLTSFPIEDVAQIPNLLPKLDPNYSNLNLNFNVNVNVNETTTTKTIEKKHQQQKNEQLVMTLLKLDDIGNNQGEEEFLAATIDTGLLVHNQNLADSKYYQAKSSLQQLEFEHPQRRRARNDIERERDRIFEKNNVQECNKVKYESYLEHFQRQQQQQEKRFFDSSYTYNYNNTDNNKLNDKKLKNKLKMNTNPTTMKVEVEVEVEVEEVYAEEDKKMLQQQQHKKNNNTKKKKTFYDDTYVENGLTTENINADKRGGITIADKDKKLCYIHTREYEKPTSTSTSYDGRGDYWPGVGETHKQWLVSDNTLPSYDFVAADKSAFVMLSNSSSSSMQQQRHNKMKCKKILSAIEPDAAASSSCYLTGASIANVRKSADNHSRSRSRSSSSGSHFFDDDENEDDYEYDVDDDGIVVVVGDSDDDSNNVARNIFLHDHYGISATTTSTVTSLTTTTKTSTLSASAFNHKTMSTNDYRFSREFNKRLKTSTTTTTTTNKMLAGSSSLNSSTLSTTSSSSTTSASISSQQQQQQQQLKYYLPTYNTQQQEVVGDYTQARYFERYFMDTPIQPAARTTNISGCETSNEYNNKNVKIRAPPTFINALNYYGNGAAVDSLYAHTYAQPTKYTTNSSSSSSNTSNSKRHSCSSYNSMTTTTTTATLKMKDGRADHQQEHNIGNKTNSTLTLLSQQQQQQRYQMCTISTITNTTTTNTTTSARPKGSFILEYEC